MVTAHVEETVRVPPERFLEFVLDIDRYATEVDKKIRPVLWSERDGDTVTFACRPKLVGLRQPKVVQYLRRTGNRIDIGLEPLPRNRIAHRMASFSASVECRPADEGCHVTRILQFDFTAPVRPVAEPLFRRRLQAEVEDEIRRAKAYLEREA
ncbi:SRPBCC family protein [Prauserella rugosa]|uniref:Polyketide cyclase/dehydrase/lipid transport protein n=1 Tax=Prauserella rugosa TaxID=43354 RepID=A0A660CKL9_9PSEU|nr:SRPBCC family protein [Prauserella rugosa]KMS87359.1 hypothetical protein ACZ91_31690 [Streptomyces regensis]TWH22427.1 polyketide cyclase/dehydrase/lipid transport protein [Prauserella rugosa]